MTTGHSGGDGFRLRLYVAGEGPNSQLARANLERLLAEWPGRPPTVEVLDVFDHAAAAAADAVMVTPALVRLAPGPRRVVVGTLADREQIRAALGAPGAAAE